MSRADYTDNRELERARMIGRPLRSMTSERRLGVVIRGIAGVLVWGVILFAVTGATAILMGY